MADIVYYSLVRKDTDGVTTVWEFSFAGGYIDREYVKAVMIDVDAGSTTPVEFTWVGPNQIKIEPALPAGKVLEIFRDTYKAVPLVDFTDGSILNEGNMNRNAEQAVHAVAELSDRYQDTNTTSLAASAVAAEALQKSEAAVDASADAVSKATAAVSTANSATAKAQEALSATATAVAAAEEATTAAINATTAANAVVDVATGAAADAASAVTIATGIDGKAQLALDTANDALSIAETVDPNLFWKKTEFDPDSKAEKVHDHTIGDVVGLPAALDGKAPTSHTHAIGDITGLQAALDDKQPKGNYQPALGYTPVNRAGDWMTGSLTTDGNFRAGSAVMAGNLWGDWSATTMMDSNSIWFGNHHNRFRIGIEDGSICLWRYSGTGTYAGRTFRVDNEDVMHFDKRPTVGGSPVLTAEGLPGALTWMPHDSIGSFAFLTFSGNGDARPGVVRSGVELRWSNSTGTGWGGPPGSWRCMGNTSGALNSPGRATLWQRVF